MSIRDEVRHAPGYRFSAHPYRVKLDQNEAPDDLPRDVRARALAKIEARSWNRYPSLHGHSVARALAARDGWDPDGVVVANGSNVLIQGAILAAGLGRRVATASPTFAVYGDQARVLGVPVHEVPLRTQDFGLDAPAFRAVLADGPGALFLADPAAPTGNRLADDDVGAVLDAASEHDWTAFVDEAYAPFDGRDRLDLVRGRHERVSLRTLSKAEGLAGARLGYALCSPDTARQLEKVLLPFRLSALQVAVAEAVLEAGAEARDARIRHVVRERERIRSALAELGDVHPFPSDTNFVTFRVDDPAAVHRRLLAQGILIRRQDHLPGLAGCLRVTMGRSDENDAFLQALPHALVGETVHG